MKTQKPKFIILLICFLAFSFNAVAQESIQFVLKVNNDDFLRFYIRATKEKQFIVNWGDGSDIENFTGLGTIYWQDPWLEVKHYYAINGNYTVNITGITADCLFTEFAISGGPYLWLTHLDVNKCPSLQALAFMNTKFSTLDLSKNTALTHYLECAQNQLSTLDLRNNPALGFIRCYENQLSALDLSSNSSLIRLECNNNKLSSLSVNSNNKLKHLECQNNKLTLSNLYEISKTIKPNSESEIVLGEQRLTSRTIEVGEHVDFSAEKEFGGFATVFTIEKDNLPAPESDYTITGGIITFFTEGKYSVRMSNSGFFEGWPILISPANVFVEINVGNVGIETITKDELRITVYPNPTTGELRVMSEELRVLSIEAFDIFGRKLQFNHLITTSSNHHINISHFTTGIYFIKITTEQGNVVKKVIKH